MVIEIYHSYFKYVNVEDTDATGKRIRQIHTTLPAKKCDAQTHIKYRITAEGLRKRSGLTRGLPIGTTI
jgi:uncharacterized protein YdhG (YjbR/CyaY superfamily)